MFGFSRRHGPHQLAQKSIKTNFPLSEDNLIKTPFGFLKSTNPDHKKIIDACAANKVVIELNAHPSRLDMDWRYIAYALEKNVLISINPDAHNLEGFDDTRYGVLVAQKALLTKEQNLSSFGLKEFEGYLEKK